MFMRHQPRQDRNLMLVVLTNQTQVVTMVEGTSNMYPHLVQTSMGKRHRFKSL